jgi:hypothetical protein
VEIAGFQQVRFRGVLGGPYDEFNHPKIIWHTWEGTNWHAAETAFSPYPPHFAVNPKDRVKKQYVPLDRHSYALRGSDSDNSYCIQIECAGFAGQMPGGYTEDDYKWLGEEVAGPICDLLNIPPIIPSVGFKGDKDGISPPLASLGSPIRFKSTAELDAFTGHCGHQHIPPPDVHWDPGAIDIAKLLKYAYPDLGHDTDPQEDDVAASPVRLIRGNDKPDGPIYVWDYQTKEGPISKSIMQLVSLTAGTGAILQMDPKVLESIPDRK